MSPLVNSGERHPDLSDGIRHVPADVQSSRRIQQSPCGVPGQCSTRQTSVNSKHPGSAVPARAVPFRSRIRALPMCA